MQRPVRKLLRALPTRVRDRLPGRFVFVYKSDGLATVHYSPLLYDTEFNEAYWSVADRWPGGPLDLRWRVWVLTECARQCQSLSGNYAEFGVYRGATSFMILARVALRDDQTMFLFDTFAGIPDSGLTEDERAVGLGSRYADTSTDDVVGLLRPWQRSVVTVAGDVHATVNVFETGPLAFAHLDLNAASATLAGLEYAYARLVPRGMLVFDDYGWRSYEDQREAVDTFFEDKPESVLCLPTGQALVVKL